MWRLLRPTVATCIYTYSRRMRREVATFFDHSWKVFLLVVEEKLEKTPSCKRILHVIQEYSLKGKIRVKRYLLRFFFFKQPRWSFDCSSKQIFLYTIARWIDGLIRRGVTVLWKQFYFTKNFFFFLRNISNVSKFDLLFLFDFFSVKMIWQVCAAFGILSFQIRDIL